ncbi:MAG: DUF5317 family protein [Gemmatimonadaceae bacterium]
MLASGVLLGLIAGTLVRRTWAPLQSLKVRWLPWLILGLIGRIVAPFADSLAMPFYLFALGSTAVVAAMNPRLIGAVVVALGSVLNFAVVFANWGMPVDPAALDAAGARMPGDPLHVALTSTSALATLADVLPVAIVHGVYSVGDVLIASGAFLIPFVVLTRR